MLVHSISKRTEIRCSVRDSNTALYLKKVLYRIILQSDVSRHTIISACKYLHDSGIKRSLHFSSSLAVISNRFLAANLTHFSLPFPSIHHFIEKNKYFGVWFILKRLEFVQDLRYVNFQSCFLISMLEFVASSENVVRCVTEPSLKTLFLNSSLLTSSTCRLRLHADWFYHSNQFKSQEKAFI